MVKQSDSQEPTQKRGITFKVAIDGDPDKPVAFIAHAFGPGDVHLASVPVRNGVAELPLDAKKLKNARLFFAPKPPKGDDTPPSIQEMERLHAYEPLWSFDTRQRIYEVMPIPEDIYKFWPLCSCRVRGEVVKVEVHGGVTYEKPVCGARVHICDVDKWFILLPKIPDYIIWQIRDELLDLLRQPPFPPFPPPELDPRFIDPGFIDPIPFIAQGVNVFGNFDDVFLNPQPLPPKDFRQAFVHPADKVGLNPQPIPPGFDRRFMGSRARVAFDPQPEPPGRNKFFTGKLLNAEDLQQDFSYLKNLPPAFISGLLSESTFEVRQALLDNFAIIKPYFCELFSLHPYFLTCDELATTITDEQGRFDLYVYYNCFGDHPDLYFWVDVSIGGSWTTVYQPSRYCSTHWNYTCGSNVTIRIYDDRVSGCGENPVLLGKKLVVKSIGREVGMGEILRLVDGVLEGQVAPGWIHASKTSPFGATLEFRVDFGDRLVPNNITHYRWSARPLGSLDEDDWQVLDTDVRRHYRETTPPGDPPIYKSVLVGPDPDFPGLLYKIEPQLPAGGEEFEVLDEGYDLASAYLDTTTLAAGKYELKLELFKNIAGVMHLANLSSENVELYELDVAPFTEDTYVANSPTSDRFYRPGGPGTDIFGYRLVIHVDNRVCFGTINDVVVNGLGAGVCGFLEYSDLSDNANISFRASHPGNFAVFDFDVYRVSTPLPAASAPGAGWVGDAPGVEELIVTGFARLGDTFSKLVSIFTLMNDNLPLDQTACTRAAFAEVLHIYALATNGYSRLTYLDGPRPFEDPSQVAVKAFAITPAGPSTT